MSEKQYVLHISGQGEKWEVRYEYPFAWNVRRMNGQDEPLAAFDLPKSEYRLCDPPERWVDVTIDCGWVEPSLGERGGIKHFGPCNAVCTIYWGYRLRKVQLSNSDIQPDGQRHYSNCWAFIVEKREP